MIADEVASACGAGVAGSRAVSGGDINEALRVELDDGRVLFVKHRSAVPQGFYDAEAAGLLWLAEADALPVPEVVAVSGRWLALAWVDSRSRGASFDAELGRGLAALHASGAPRFGATGPEDDAAGPTYLGSVAVPNDEARDWPSFYGSQRLEPLLRMAADAGALPSTGAIERVIARLDDLCGPAEPPARLHGDLWSGNVLAGPGGAPWLIDPAAYGGHREVDLAMLTLFGSPGADFFAAYDEVAPLADGWRDRVPLYQLLPLLVHAVLFGGGYGASAVRAAERCS